MGCSIQKSKTVNQQNTKDGNETSNSFNRFVEINSQKNQFIISSVNQRRGFLLNTVPKLNQSSNELYQRRKLRDPSPLY